MNTNYDDEATQFMGQNHETEQNEETKQKVNSSSQKPEYKSSADDEVEVKDAKSSGWKKVAAGAGTGILLGGVATMLMGMKAPEDVNVPEGASEESANPAWVDDEISVASSVNDGMSFDEAFAAAREEVGPGGCFEWHGGVYGTYYANEWNNMTAEERAEFGHHFSWSNHHSTGANVAEHTTTTHTDHSTDHHTDVNQIEHGEDEVEVVSVNNQSEQGGMEHVGTPGYATAVSQVLTGEADEVEILGVVHNPDTEVNFGAMVADGQGVIFIDVDNDLEFDYMASDLNHSGQLDRGEVVDIQGVGVTVDHLGGFVNPTDDMLASNEDMDFSGDMYEV